MFCYHQHLWRIHNEIEVREGERVTADRWNEMRREAEEASQARQRRAKIMEAIMVMILAALVIAAFQSFPQVMADTPGRQPAASRASSTVMQVLAAHPLATFMFLIFVLLISSIAFMQPGMPGFGAGRNQVPQATYGLSSLKIPPAWSAENKAYPFRKWVNDVLLWAATTDLGEDSASRRHADHWHRQGPN